MQLRPLNEDVAIITIHPMPPHEVQFPVIYDIVREFVVEHMRVEIKEIQPCHLGQAFVRFEYVHDRDRLVHTSPHHHSGLEFSLAKHNQGRNWTSINFNRECWLMLLGFPLDYWDQLSVENAIGSFGRLVSWEKDLSHLARIILRARVVDLESVPEFIVMTEGEGFLGQSWTIQCEIIQHEPLDVMPADEAPFPDVGGGPNPPYDFFGFGQEGMPPFHQEQAEQEDNAEDNKQDNFLGQWLVLGARPQNEVPAVPDLNDAPNQG